MEILPVPVSKSRLAVRFVLVLILLGVIGLVGYAWINNRPDALWDSAQTAINEGDNEAAILYLRNLLKQQPDHADAHLALAKALRDEKRKNVPNATYAQVGEAVDHLARAAELRPKDPKILEPLLTAYGQLGREKQAVKTAGLLEKVDRNNAEALYWLARDALSERDAKAAGPLLERLRSLKGEPRPRTMKLLAELYEVTKQPKRRNDVLAAALQASGQLRIIPRRDREALDELLLAAVTSAPTATEADRRLAVALQFQERRSRSAKLPLEAAQATLDLVRTDLAAHPVKTDDAKRVKAMKPLLTRSIALVEAAAKSDRATPNLQFELVRLIMFSGDTAKAIATTEAALQRLENSKTRNENVELDLHLIAAEALYRQGKLKSALKHANVLVKRGRKETHLAAGHLLAGTIHADEGRHEIAVFHFREAQKNGLGQSLRVHLGLANSYAALGRWQEARPHLEALNIPQKDITGPDAAWAKVALGDRSRIRLRLARAYLETGEIEAARRILDAFKGTEHEPTTLALQVMHDWKSDRALARTQMNAARAKFPTNLPLAYLDIRMHLAANNPRKAKEIASQLAKKRPMDLTAQVLMYSVLIRQRDYTAAVKLLDDLIQRFPKKPGLVLAKARTLLDAKRNKEAADVARQLAKNPDWKTAAEYIGALAALRSQDLKDAASRLEALQGGQRQVGDLDLLKAKLSLSQGNPDEAIRELGSALQYTRLQQVAGRSLLRSLLVLAYEKTPQDALKKVDGLLKQHPAQASLLLAKAELQTRTGNYSGALESLKTLDSANPNAVDGAYYQARFWLGMYQFANARREAERAVEIAPQNLNARFLAASIALRDDRLEEAISHLDAGLKLASANTGFLLLKATVLKRQKKNDEAIALLKQITKDSPDRIQAWLLLAGFYTAEKRPDDALKTLADARQKNPGDTTLVRETIRTLVSHKKLDDADKLAATLAGDKFDYQTLSRLTQAFESAGETGRARQWADKALAAARAAKKDSQIDVAELQLANLALLESNKPKADAKWLEDARSRFAAIVKRNPKHLVAANNLAWLLTVRFNDPQQARKVIDPIATGYRMDRLPASAIDTILIVYERQKDFVALEKLLKEAMRVQPGNSKWIRAYVGLAIRRNRLDEAISELEEMHRRRGWWPEPSYGLARIYAAMNRPRDALAALQRALTIAPRHLESQVMATGVAAQLGQSQLVLQHADAALKLNPDLWKIRLRKAEALKRLKRTDEAEQVLDAGISQLQSGLNKSPTAAAYVALSRLVQARDGDEKALAVLQEGLQKFPGEFAIVIRALVLLLQDGKFSDATAMLDRHVPENAPVSRLVAVGSAYNDFRKYDSALEWAGRALARATESEKPVIWTLQGHVLLGKGSTTKNAALIEQARAKYEAVLKRSPNNLVAANNLAWLLATELNRPAEALKVAERIRADAPVERMNRTFIDTLSVVYRKAKEWKKARDLLQQATATFATHAPFHLQLGEVYIATNDLRAAQRALQRALELGLSKPDTAHARALLAQVAKQAGPQ